MHTSICSINGSIDKLETLLTKLPHTFDLLTFSETWNSSNMEIGRVVERYQAYHVVSEHTLKNECRFLIKEDLKYKQTQS